MTVSLVGRMAMGRSSSLLPLLVTQATCAQGAAGAAAARRGAGQQPQDCCR